MIVLLGCVSGWVRHELHPFSKCTQQEQNVYVTWTEQEQDCTWNSQSKNKKVRLRFRTFRNCFVRLRTPTQGKNVSVLSFGPWTACDAQDFTQKEVLLFAIFVLCVFLLSAVDVFLISTAHSQLHTHSCGHDSGARCTCSCSIECSCFAKRCSCNVRQSEFHTIQRSPTWENARTIHFSLKHQYV